MASSSNRFVPLIRRGMLLTVQNVIGASREWGIRNVLFGTIPDVIADRSPCSVLMVRRYITEDWKIKATEGLKRVKEQLGMSTSPDTGNER